MGKYRTNPDLASRLSITTTSTNKPNYIHRIDDTRNTFKSDRFNPKQDARLKLTSNSRAIARYEQNKVKNFDARDILINKNKNNKNNYKSKPNKNEPIVIVTGLGNVIHEGNRVKIAANRSSSSSSSSSSKQQHYVVNDGVNTLITLKNDLVRRKERSSSPPQAPASSHNRNKSKYEEILISIKNDDKPLKKQISYDNNMDFETNIKTEPTINSRLFNNTSYNNNNNVNYSNKIDYYKQIDNLEEPINNYSKNGYKLTISNLANQVTQQDLLELFSNIGPLKRSPEFIAKGMAEVVYTKLDDAKQAIENYDQHYFDGNLMVIGFADQKHSEEAKRLKNLPKQQYRHESPAREQNSNINNNVFAYLPHNETLSNKFKIINGNKDKSSVQIPESRHDSNLAVDNSIIHQVLFNKKTNSTNQKPVTFTVKL